MAKKELSVYERFQAAQSEVFELSKLAQEAQDNFLEKRSELQAIMKELPPEVRSLYAPAQPTFSGRGVSAERPRRPAKETVDSADVARVKRKILDELTTDGKKFLASERREIAGDLETFKAAINGLIDDGKAARDPNGPDRGIGMMYVKVEG